MGNGFLRGKQPRHEADYSPPSSYDVKECVELYIHSLYTPTWRGAQLKHRNNFTFILYYIASYITYYIALNYITLPYISLHRFDVR